MKILCMFTAAFPEFSASMQTGIIVGLVFFGTGLYDKKRKVRDIIRYIVADVRHVILMRGHLPGTLPDLLDFLVMKFLAGILADRNFGWPGVDRRITSVGFRNGVLRIGVQQLMIAFVNCSYFYFLTD